MATKEVTAILLRELCQSILKTGRNPWVDLSKSGILLSHHLSQVKGDTLSRERSLEPCMICGTRSEVGVEPCFESLLTKLCPNSGEEEERGTCAPCGEVLSSIIKLGEKVVTYQAQISNAITALKTMIRHTQRNKAETKEEFDEDPVLEPVPRRRVVQRGKKRKSSSTKANKVINDRVQQILGLEEEELPGSGLAPWEEVGKHPLQLEVKEEPLDYGDFSEDWFLAHEEKEVSVSEGLTLENELEDGVKDEVETGRRRSGMRKSKLKARQTLSRIAKEETHPVPQLRQTRRKMISHSDQDYQEEKVDPEDARPLRKKRNRRAEITRAAERAALKLTPAICTVCVPNLTFPSHASLHVHRLRQHDPHTCKVCGMLFKCRKSWTDHVRAKHEGVRRHPCPHTPCKKSFYKRSARDEHATTCPQNPNRSEEVTHYSKKKSSLPGPASNLCDHCGAAFRYACTLRNHVFLKHGVLAPKIRATHTPPETYSCSSCEKRFLSEAQLRYHAEIHKPKEERLSCDDCKISFKSLGDRLEHRRRVHEGRTTFGCEICVKRFTKLNRLQWHVQHQHTAKEGLAQRLICEKCGVTFAGKKTLDFHVKYYEDKGMDCRKGVKKRPRVLGKLVGTKSRGRMGLDSDELRGVVDNMSARRREGAQDKEEDAPGPETKVTEGGGDNGCQLGDELIL